MRVYFVTSNRSKHSEIERVLGARLPMASMELHEMQAIKVREVVEDKAERAYDRLKKPLIVEDTGLYLNALNGFPGALSSWLLDSAGNEGLCKMLDNFKDRGAYAETYICFYDGKRKAVFSGRVDGAIARRPKGSGGFGWDPIFIPRGYDKTFAEMGAEKRNTMRTKAALKLKRYLASLR
jgi:XTP/dITP diphosphohydrolase